MNGVDRMTGHSILKWGYQWLQKILRVQFKSGFTGTLIADFPDPCDRVLQVNNIFTFQLCIAGKFCIGIKQTNLNLTGEVYIDENCSLTNAFEKCITI